MPTAEGLPDAEALLDNEDARLELGEPGFATHDRRAHLGHLLSELGKLFLERAKPSFDRVEPFGVFVKDVLDSVEALLDEITAEEWEEMLARAKSVEAGYLEVANRKK